MTDEVPNTAFEQLLDIDHRSNKLLPVAHVIVAALNRNFQVQQKLVDGIRGVVHPNVDQGRFLWEVCKVELQVDMFCIGFDFHSIENKNAKLPVVFD